MADGKRLLPPVTQIQMIRTAQCFPREASFLHKARDAALGLAPVQPESGRQLRLCATRMLAHVDDREE